MPTEMKEEQLYCVYLSIFMLDSLIFSLLYSFVLESLTPFEICFGTSTFAETRPSGPHSRGSTHSIGVADEHAGEAVLGLVHS